MHHARREIFRQLFFSAHATNRKNRKNRQENVRGYVNLTPDLTDPTEFHRVLLNRHWTCRTDCTAAALRTAAVAVTHPLLATGGYDTDQRLGIDHWLLLGSIV